MTNSIPIHELNMDVFIGDKTYSEEVLHGVIPGLQIFHKACKGPGKFPIKTRENQATVLLILTGRGQLDTDLQRQDLEEASMVILPNGSSPSNLVLTEHQKLHFLEFNKQFSKADIESLRQQEFQFDKLYFKRYQDCSPYTEKIKSPNTISRTILPAEIIPRVALGTVEAIGPDRVGAHSHPMLEQIFIGLSDNSIRVYASSHLDTYC